MYQNEIEDEYFEWLCSLVSKQRFAEDISYKKLFAQLHSTPFRYSIPLDENRAEDGLDLRDRFATDNGFDEGYFSEYLDGNCSMLELMIALAIRCEETIMLDGAYGDRTSQWFWGMVTSLGLGSMTDDAYDQDLVEESIETFLERKYRPDGRGGLFTIRGCDVDLRDVEIWTQLCWYLDSIS